MHAQAWNRIHIAPVAATVMLPLFAGCGIVIDTPEAACNRMVDHIMECYSEAGLVDSLDVDTPIPGVGSLREYLRTSCAAASESPLFATYADCVTSQSCETLMSPTTSLAPTSSCMDLLAGVSPIE